MKQKKIDGGRIHSSMTVTLFAIADGKVIQHKICLQTIKIMVVKNTTNFISLQILSNRFYVKDILNYVLIFFVKIISSFYFETNLC